jgi:hypothetical protein
MSWLAVALAAEEPGEEGAAEGAVGGDSLGFIDAEAVGPAVAGFFVGLGEAFGGLFALDGAPESS